MRSAAPPRGGSPSKVFRPWSPEQTALLPASKRDYLGDDHLAVFLLDLLPTLTCSRSSMPIPKIGGSPRTIPG